MDIRFISSLTPDDEEQVAPALLRAVSTLLDQFAIVYSIRIETSGRLVFQHAHPALNGDAVEGAAVDIVSALDANTTFKSLAQKSPSTQNKG
jgi:hypothetical protein